MSEVIDLRHKGGTIQVTKLVSHAVFPSRSYPDDAGWDLEASEHADIEAGAFVDIHTGVAIRFPRGVWGRITGRSSTFRRLGLLVVEGIIDTGYTGELMVGVFNPGPQFCHIMPGTRLAQMLLHQHVHVDWEEVDELAPTARGSNGFGSSGQ